MFEQPTQFLEWMEKNSFQLHPQLIFKDDHETGRGVWAKEDIDEDICLFRIPFERFLSVFTSKCPPIKLCKEEISKKYSLDEDTERIINWIQLCISIMYEYSIEENSLWYEYLHHFLPLSLEKEPINAPYFWKDADLQKLQGTECELKIKQQKEEIDLQWKIIEENILDKSIFNNKQKQKQIFTKQFYSNISFVVLSYSFTLDSKSLPNEKQFENVEYLIGMCPMADALNHKTGYNNARLFTQNEVNVSISSDLFYEMRSFKSIQKNTEVFNTYGELSNSDLLVKYGFIDNENINDNITFSLLEVLIVCAQILFSDQCEKFISNELHSLFSGSCENSSSNVTGKRKDAPSSSLSLFMDWKDNLFDILSDFFNLSETLERDEFMIFGFDHIFGVSKEEISPDFTLLFLLIFLSSSENQIVKAREFMKETFGGCNQSDSDSDNQEEAGEEIVLEEFDEGEEASQEDILDSIIKIVVSDNSKVTIEKILQKLVQSRTLRYFVFEDTENSTLNCKISAHIIEEEKYLLNEFINVNTKGLEHIL